MAEGYFYYINGDEKIINTQEAKDIIFEHIKRGGLIVHNDRSIVLAQGNYKYVAEIKLR